MGLPLTEALYLRDIHRWSRNEHNEYVEDMNKFIDTISQHVQANSNAQSATDASGARHIGRVAN